MVRDAIENHGFVVTVEEAMLHGGFGSAFLEAANDMGLDARKVTRIGIPDLFVPHGDRPGLLADLKLDTKGIVETCMSAVSKSEQASKVQSQ